MRDFDPPWNCDRPEGDEPGEPRECDKTNRFDAASVPRALSGPGLGESGLGESGLGEPLMGESGLAQPPADEAIRDVTIESLLYRLDAALAAIRSLDVDPAPPGGPQGDAED